jgi:hypothetical protein
MPQYYHLLWKRVRVTGRFKHMGSMIQQIYATHYVADQIEALPGQDIPTDIPSLMPGPPRVRSKAEMMAAKDRSRLVEAKIESIHPAKEDGKFMVLLKLADGTDLQVGTKSTKMWDTFKGKEVVILTWIPKDFAATEPLQLFGARKICSKDTKRCGVYTMKERRRERKKARLRRRNQENAP